MLVNLVSKAYGLTTTTRVVPTPQFAYTAGAQLCYQIGRTDIDTNIHSWLYQLAGHRNT